MMAPLSANRVNFEPPFSRVGVDYTAKIFYQIYISGLNPLPLLPGDISLVLSPGQSIWR